MPLVSYDGMRSVRRTVASTSATAAAPSTGARRRTMAGASAGNFDWSPSTDWPGVTSSRLVPSRSSRPSRSARLDAEMPSTATIAAMPMAIPTAVRIARPLRVRSPVRPTAATSTGRRRLVLAHAITPAAGRASAAGPSTSRPAVPDRDAPGEGTGERQVVGDHDDGGARCVEVAEELEDLRAGARVEVAGGFVGEDDRGVPDDRPRDRDALAAHPRTVATGGAWPGGRARPVRGHPWPAARRSATRTPR